MASDLPSPNDTAKPKDYYAKFSARTTYSKHTDPCEDAAKASLTCMDRNEYDRGKCEDFFQAYRDCKRAWLLERWNDRRAGRETPV
ncbi:hypothetical protein SCLCIDRAFT_137775 [Scleroderma citrinum Foug A]|uniref:Cytochrome c oxidase-assembly factor COX23, mitochondrial n=1 Tax=Scleroderma citrinum Foug A TaxID=1036808 RepID=A0A0C3DCX1_9AGAM|nr:hypothetical protein SCLCIDRAFT_137775 [Scleroderma citrinum Foug A]